MCDLQIQNFELSMLAATPKDTLKRQQNLQQRGSLYDYVGMVMSPGFHSVTLSSILLHAHIEK